MKRAFVVLALLGLLCNAVVAQKPAVVIDNDPGWHRIGKISASFDLQKESIVVWGADEFKAIRLRVTDAPINIERLQVFYEGGEVEEISVASELQAGADTRVIQLKRPDAELNKVEFVYKTLPNYQGEKAEVELWGLKTSANAYRNDKESDVEREMDEAGDDVKRETDEAGDEIREESREANQEMKEEAREADQKLENTGEKVEEETDDAGDELKETAGNIGAEIKDKPYVDKVGPNGERIYMDKHSKYYYIDDKGNKVFITKLEMKDNPKRD